MAAIDAGIMVCDGATANIHDNALKDIRESVALSGNQRGIAIRIGRKALLTTGHATITNNVITGYQKGGIVVDNTGSDAVITGNTVTGEGPTTATAQNGIQISRGATASLNGNTVSGDDYTPGPDSATVSIFLYQSGAVTVTGNTVSAAEIGLLHRHAFDARLRQLEQPDGQRAGSRGRRRRHARRLPQLVGIARPRGRREHGLGFRDSRALVH